MVEDTTGVDGIAHRVLARVAKLVAGVAVLLVEVVVTVAFDTVAHEALVEVEVGL